jgi:hypothetical protein
MWTCLETHGELNMVTRKTTVVKEEPVKKTTRKRTVAAEDKTIAKSYKEKPATKPRAKKETSQSISKAEATRKKLPWVAVLETHVNPDNPSNGFFELDWNEYFIVQLKGHGYDGPTEESIVDVWFQNLCRNIGSEEGVNMERRGSGYININNLGNGKSEVS